MLSMVETAALPGPLGMLIDLLIACRAGALKLLARKSSVGDGVIFILYWTLMKGRGGMMSQVKFIHGFAP